MKTLAILLFVFSNITNAFADCPIPSTAIDPTVSVAVAFDKKTKMYTYTYRLANSRSAPLAINRFSIRISEQPAAIANPNSWKSRYVDNKMDPANVSWVAFPQLSDLPKISESEEATRVTKISSAVSPGSSRQGFSIKSPFEPGPVVFNAEGYAQLPESAEGDDEDSCAPDIGDQPRSSSLVTGITTGPFHPSQQQLKIRLREGDGKRCRPFDPRVSKGKIYLVVLPTQGFDPRSIDVSSLKFGPDEVAPMNSIQSVPLAADFSEEALNWEENAIESRHSKNQKGKSIVLEFDREALGIQCGIDRALFLRGQTTNGKPVFGGISTSFLGCDVSKPGRRRGGHKH